MILEPVGQRVIVKRLSEEQTKSGLILTKDTQKRSMVGEVLHAGPETSWVKEGDVVLFARFSGYEFPVDRGYIDEKYEGCLVMNEEDVISKITSVTETVCAMSSVDVKEIVESHV